MTQFCTTSSWIVAVSLMDLHPALSQLQYLALKRFNIYRIGFKRPASMIWWYDYGSSLGRKLSQNADVPPTYGCIHKSVVSMHWEKDHDAAYKMAMTLEMKRKIVDCEFSIDCIFIRCQFVSTNLWVASVLCEDCHVWSALLGSASLSLSTRNPSTCRSLSWRRCNSCDDSALAFELPPATYINLRVSGSTDSAGTQNTRQKNTHTRTHAARRSQSPKGGVQLHKQPDGTL